MEGGRHGCCETELYALIAQPPEHAQAGRRNGDLDAKITPALGREVIRLFFHIIDGAVP